MTDSSKRSNAGSSEIELECRQLTLDECADALPAIAGPSETPTRGSASSEVAAAAVRLNDDEPSSRIETATTTPHRLSATELLETPDALLTRTHLRELGLERRAIDAVFRALAVVALPGYSRPMVRVGDFLELLERCTFRDDRVRPIAGSS
jgi:hypothetical protein